MKHLLILIVMFLSSSSFAQSEQECAKLFIGARKLAMDGKIAQSKGGTAYLNAKYHFENSNMEKAKQKKEQAQTYLLSSNSMFLNSKFLFQFIIKQCDKEAQSSENLLEYIVVGLNQNKKIKSLCDQIIID